MTNRWFVIIVAPIFLTICWPCGDSLVSGESSPMVDVKNGTLEGSVMTSRSGRSFFAFRGIPYAQPPLGKLRFEPAEPFDSWIGPRSAKQDSNVCTQRDVLAHQRDVVGVEDCLYLNVYTPKLPSNDANSSRTRYPVIVWLHGGGFFAGSGISLFHGPKFLLDHDIVFVAPNYRLGALGFLSTEDTVCPGNLGLKDQVKSLVWIQENIEAFGGDPNSVTIFGESAGGASVHYHMLSPLSKGLFHRAISQSGTALTPWAMSPKPGHARNQAKRVGKLLDCPTDDSKALVECLRTKSAIDIIATDHSFQVFDYCPIIPFPPVVEPDHPGAFMTEEPLRASKLGHGVDVPWLTGITSHEGAIRISAILGLKDKGYDRMLEERFMELLPISLLYEPTCPKELRDNATKSIREFYLGDKKIDESAKWELIDIYTDRFFAVPADNAVRDHLNTFGSPVYYYLFAYRGSSSISVLFGDAENDYGVCHADDLQYIFPVVENLLRKALNNEDNKMVDLMTAMFVNFAKSGNPTPEITPEVPVKWKPVRTSNLEYLHIKNSKDMVMDENLFADRVKFWESAMSCEKSEKYRNLRRDRDEL